MTPTTVKMAEHIREITDQESSLGNIISRSYRGWSNLYQGYLLGLVGYTVGNPRNSSYMVINWVSGEPRWSQPPQKLYSTGFNAIMTPVQGSSEAPELNTINLPL